MIEIKIPTNCPICEKCWYHTEPYLKAGYKEESIRKLCKQGVVPCIYGGPFNGYIKIE